MSGFKTSAYHTVVRIGGDADIQTSCVKEQVRGARLHVFAHADDSDPVVVVECDLDGIDAIRRGLDRAEARIREHQRATGRVA